MTTFFLFLFHRWKRQSAEEDIYKMDKSAPDEGKNYFSTNIFLFRFSNSAFEVLEISFIQWWKIENIFSPISLHYDYRSISLQ